MRPSPHWMTQLDSAILEFCGALPKINGSPVVVTPNFIQNNLEYQGVIDRGRSTYSRRMRELAGRGFFDSVDEEGSPYIVLEKTRQWYRGELDLEDFD